MKFRLIDRIIDIRHGERIKTRKAVSFEEYSLSKLWGRKGVLPESLIVQFAVESACHLIAFTTNFQKIGILKEIIIARFFEQTMPGDILFGTIDMSPVDQTRLLCDFKIQTEDKQLADGSFIAEPIPLHNCFHPDHYMLMWRGICEQTAGT